MLSGKVAPSSSSGAAANFAEMARRVRCSNEEQFDTFVAGVEALLQQWTALLLVNQHRDANALVSVRNYVVDWFFEEGEVYSDELEVYFLSCFENDRNVSVEDGSCKEVADIIAKMYVQCANGNNAETQKWCASLPVYQSANPVQASVFGGTWAGDAEGHQVLVSNNNQNDDDGDGESNNGVVVVATEEEEVVTAPPPPPPRQQSETKKKNKTNPFSKGKDGWCTVQRK